MSKATLKKILIGAAFLLGFALLMVFLFSGENFDVIRALFQGDTDRVIEELKDLGWKGVFVIVFLSMMQVVLTFLPSEPTQVLSGISYGLGWGLVWCMIGVTIGNTIIFVLYRIYGDKLDKYFHKNITVDFEVLRHSKRIVLLILILYFLPAIPYGLICFFTATVYNKSYVKYFLLTTLGSIPSEFMGVALGHIAINESWIISIILFVVLVTLLVLMYVYREKVFAKINEFAQKQFTYSSKTTIKPHKMWLCRLLNPLLRLFTNSKVRLKVNRHVDKIEGPAIIVANHGSFVDFLYLATILNKENFYIVASRQYFYQKSVGKLMKSVGAFPKSMFTNDVENVRNCLRVLKDNGILVIFPEARLSTVGKFEDIQPKTCSFLRRTGANIYLLKYGGDYLAMPKWARKNGKFRFRKKALVEADLSLLLTGEQANAMSEDDFEKLLTDSLNYNEFDWLNNHPQETYKTKHLAEGLQNVLYRCPKCGKSLTLTTKGNKLVCSDCGLTVEMNDRYGFDENAPFANLQQWYRWQEQTLLDEILANPNYTLCDNVTLYHQSSNGKKQIAFAGKGVCTLDRNGLTYKGTDGDLETEKFFPINEIYRLLFGADENFELYQGENYWYFVPTNPQSSVVWYIASGLMWKLHNGQITETKQK